MRTGTSRLTQYRRYGQLGATLERIKRLFTFGASPTPSIPGDPGTTTLILLESVTTLRALRGTVTLSAGDVSEAV